MTLSWVIDGDTAVVGDDVAVTARRLDITFEVERADVARWRRLDRTGDYAVTSGYGGRYRVVDDSGRPAPIVVEPPSELSPPLKASSEWYVGTYEEAQTSADRYEISLGLQRPENRSGAFTAPREPATTGWHLDTADGGLDLDAEQVRLTSSSGSTSGGVDSLALRVTGSEAVAVVDTAGYPAGVVTREVAAGRDYPVDTTPNGVQSVQLRSPGVSAFTGGQYAIRSWTLTREGEGRRPWRLDLSLALLSRQPTTGQLGGSRYGNTRY